VLDPIWRDGDDVMYRVGQPHASLARVVPELVSESRTRQRNRLDALRRYVAALDSARCRTRLSMDHRSFRRDTTISSRTGRVRTTTYHPGWRAIVNGHAVPIKRDGLGLMSIDSGAGPTVIDFRRRRRYRMQIASG